MKTLFKNLLITGLTLTTLTGFSNELDSAMMANIIISVEDVKPGHKLYIKDQQGSIIYKEVITETGTFKKNFDLEALPDGSYNLEIERDFEIEITPIKIVNHKAELLSENSSLYFKPVVRLEGDKIFVSKMNFNNEPIKLELQYESKYGSTFESLYSETFTEMGTLERIYEIERNNLSTYRVIVKSDDRTYTNEIKI